MTKKVARKLIPFLDRRRGADFYAHRGHLIYNLPSFSEVRICPSEKWRISGHSNHATLEEAVIAMWVLLTLEDSND